jgi:K+-transporting ATPase ATPase A chain
VTIYGWLQAGLALALILALTKPLGITWRACSAASGPGFRPCSRPSSGRSNASAGSIALFAFSVIGLLYLYVLLRTQKWLPFNPQRFDNLSPDLAWNTRCHARS